MASNGGRSRGFGRRGFRSSRGRRAALSRGNPTPCYTSNSITISPDGNSLLYSRMDGNSIGEQSQVTGFSGTLKVVGEYSEDSDKKFTNDRSYISYLQTKYLPTDTKEKIVHLDLTVAESEGEAYTGTGEQGLHNVLCWIINNKEVFLREINAKESNPDGGQFVMTKNAIAAISKTPYMFSVEVSIYAVSLNGIIYMLRERSQANEEKKDLRTGLLSHKFEQYLTKEDVRTGIISNEDFRVMLAATLGPHKLLYSAATDCADPELFENEFSDLSAFVGLKCNEELPKDLWYLDPKFRFMHHYMYCLLSGVPRILIGYRDSSSIVSRLRLMTPSDLLQEGKQFWNPINCLTFASEMLSFIKEKVETDPGTVFGFKKESKKAEIVCTKATDVKVLPEWFIEDINETSSD